ncbi:hypothetical protein BROUX41_002910 [Berkeleyomyces rouxiae]|uniref:uncharacterized protein n=1 Tax=Berkeleyomyces rouxiae TaxID=2035830 RepID=UPI003B7C6BA2
MADPASKRRRTSSRTSTQVRPDTEAPSNDNIASQSNGQTPRNPSKRPASFASPTKASLSRSNPEILALHSLAPEDLEATTSNGRAQESNDSSHNQPTESLPSADQNTPRASATAAKAKRGSLFPNGANTFTRRLSERPRRSSSTRPSDPEDDAPNPFRGKTLRRSGTGLSNMSNAVSDDQPEPIPDQLGTNDTNATVPRTRIQRSSSPAPQISTRPSLSSQTIPNTSQPSQTVEVTPDNEVRRAKSPHNQQPRTQETRSVSPSSQIRAKKAGAKEYAAKIAGPAVKPKWTAPGARGHRHTQSTIDPARGMNPRDEYWEKRELIERLKQEAQLLQADLNFAKSENNRIRTEVLDQYSARSASTSSTQGAQVLRLLKTHVLPAEKSTEPTLSQQMLDIALNTMSWLPFGDTTALPTLPEATTEPESEVRSHKPIKMTMDEEKPFLTLFTSLAFQSSIVMLEQKSDKDHLLMKHTIDVSPITNPGTFAAQIEMTVDCQKLVITNLSVPKIDIRAQAELGVFIDLVLHSPRNRSLKNNICVVTWAMAEWYRVATRRARVWCTLAKEIESAESIRLLVKTTRAAKRLRKDGEEEAKSPRKTDLISYMGNKALEVPLTLPGEGELMARIQWDIDFDWTGEAVSSATLLVGVPGKWQKADKRGTLSQISKLFNELVVGNNDVLAASRTIISLLAGQSS